MPDGGEGKIPSLELMCGIAGWLALADSGLVDRDALAVMRDALVHRGPDGAGLWTSADRRAGLGFRRLAIVDLSDTAMQPMPNEDGSVQVVFNGEIWNHGELRPQLEAAGHRFRTDHSDTETIVHGYEEWGDDVVHHLDGMFAFAVWDGPRRRLLLCRDRVGIKPLYFAWSRGRFLFGSEIKAILAVPGVEADVEPLAVYHYLSFLTTPAPLTMFRGIFKMPAGHRASIDLEGRFAADRYWDALPGAGERDDVRELRRLSGDALRDFAAKRTRELLDEAIAKRMMSDVPFGVMLSGGIDSSVNVALMAKHVDQPLRTFTVGFSDHPESNELDYARQVSQLFGTDHREILIDEAAMRRYLPQLVYSQDEPIADWVCIPLYFVSKLVRDSGTIVVQIGEGSDEQFCGYRSYMGYLDMIQRYWTPYRRVPSSMRRIASRAVDLLAGVHDRHDTYLDLVVRAGLDREPFWSGATVFPESRKRRLIDTRRLEALRPPSDMIASGLLPERYLLPDTFEVVRSFFDRLDERAPGSDALTRMIYSEFKLRLPELLLMRLDKIGMSVSIEPRDPFLDYKLVEFTMNVPQEAKVWDGISKALLKKAVRGLIPDNIIDRPKVGFGAPMHLWLRGEFGRAVESELRATRFFDRFPADRQKVLDMLRRHREGSSDFALYVWTFYNAVAWFDRWIDGKREVRAA